ncbi:uncharacterized protein LOC112638958 isoform X2 [Camponotus floridanus]|uniref:uncharacterized protein LOC112638958 isoform X2 n=1 Tax=Camponotus floridanus TaxID=104421 RepID=UPI000DC666F7|nr:uncharacterized protein LOC112638958 isoform X2 [Camponotus floridanus]
MWENGIIKFDEIIESQNDILHLSVSPSMGMLYGTYIVYNNKAMREYSIVKYHLDEEIEQPVKINTSFYQLHSIKYYDDIIIDDMNNEEPLIYWLSEKYVIVTDINISMCNMILHVENISNNIAFRSMTIDKTNIYILAIVWNDFNSGYAVYALKKKYASLKSVNAA